jgi:molybdopterin biosynthesis enzyme
MLGRTWQWQTVQAQMSKSLVNKGGRAEFLRVRLKYSPDSLLPVAEPLEKQESFMLTSLTEADGFVFLDRDAELSEGVPIEVMLL